MATKYTTKGRAIIDGLDLEKLHSKMERKVVFIRHGGVFVYLSFSKPFGQIQQ